MQNRCLGQDTPTGIAWQSSAPSPNVTSPSKCTLQGRQGPGHATFAEPSRAKDAASAASQALHAKIRLNDLSVKCAAQRAQTKCRDQQYFFKPVLKMLLSLPITTQILLPILMTTEY